MSRKPIRPAIKASRAASFAALKTAPASPPSASTSPARRSAGKRPSSAGAKSSRPTCVEVEPLDRQRPALGPVERVADRLAHVRGPEVGEDRAVGELDERVDDRLGVEDDRDLVGPHVEERPRLDDLERLVEHRRAVDRDALAHVPVRVRPRLLRGRRRHARQRPLAERAAGGGEDQPVEVAPRRVAEELEEGAVLAVDRAAAACRCSAQVRRSSAPAQTRLSLLASARTPPWRASSSPGARPAAPTIADIPQSTGSAAAAHSASGPASARTPLPASASAERRAPAGVGRHRDPRAEPPRLLGEQRDVGAAGQRHDLVALAAALRLDERHRVLPDRPGRSEDGDPPPHRQDPIDADAEGVADARRTRRRP